MGRNEVILLDTHVAFWLAKYDAKLGRQSRELIAQALPSGGVGVSSISFWELALLAAKKRLILHRPVEELRRTFLATGIAELALTGDIATVAVALEKLHGDPADRFIVATAIAHGATLMTADKALLRWRSKLPRQNASR